MLLAPMGHGLSSSSSHPLPPGRGCISQVDFILHDPPRDCEAAEVSAAATGEPSPSSTVVWGKGKGSGPVCAFRGVSLSCVEDDETDLELLEEAGTWAERRLPSHEHEPVVASSICSLLHQHCEGTISEICASGGVYEAFAAAQETPIKLHRCWGALARLCSKDPFVLDAQALEDVGVIGRHLLGWRLLESSLSLKHHPPRPETPTEPSRLPALTRHSCHEVP